MKTKYVRIPLNFEPDATSDTLKYQVPKNTKSTIYVPRKKGGEL